MTKAHSMNSSPRWGPLSSPGPQRACDQQSSPSEGDASQSKQTLRFAKPAGSPNHNVPWADTLTPVGRHKSIQSAYFHRPLRGIFPQAPYPPLTISCLHAYPFCAYAIANLEVRLSYIYHLG